MVSLHTFLWRFIHSHGFKSSLFQLLNNYVSANQLPKLLMLCQFSSARFRMIRSQIFSTCWNFLEIKASIIMYLEPKYHALQMSLKAIKSVTHVSKIVWIIRTKGPRWISAHKGPKHPRPSFVIPHCKLRMAAICVISCVSLGWCALRNSERVVPTSCAPLPDKSAQKGWRQLLWSHILHPEITGVRSSKLLPLLRGGDKVLMDCFSVRQFVFALILTLFLWGKIPRQVY